MYYIFTVLGSLFLLWLIIVLVILKFLKINKTKKIREDKNHFFYISKSHIKGKWWASNDGKLEKKWMEIQECDFEITNFDYKENFSKSFLNSNFKKTRLFLYKKISKKLENKVIKKIKFYTNCLENIWFKKYKIMFTNLFNEISGITEAPEYFFYKYYFRFISEIRNKMIEKLCQIIIPSIIANNLTDENIKKEPTSNEYEKNIFITLEKISLFAEEFWNLMNKKRKEEIKEKGHDWKVNYSSKNDFLNSFLPKEMIKKKMLRENIIILAKKYKIPFDGNVIETIKLLEKYSNSVEKDVINSIKLLIFAYIDEINF
ncbi:hypothetical protein [Spiroplasma floricola]|uniref:Uncharacterized protein n=1 Tax=Spiroplasma floricola 23-6 TaxID=1336749 RepID=A0A2K8SDA0_9MOLU|nr:hypothetical protein [Spiroplasma floricola]AUB31439.1 hypothetical protein SFLOR_v1c03820 [Spiroplasma floricola 23-6]